MLELLCTVKELLLCVLRGWLFRLQRHLGLHTYSLHALTDSLDPANITYSQVWEDSRTLRSALKVGEDEHVLCIASGGDNALSLLLDRPASVLAVDYSPAQVALCRLKQAGIKHLSYEQFLCLMGLQACDDLSSLQVYWQHLRKHLGPEEQAFWDERSQLIQDGLLHCGIYEKYFHLFARLLRPLAHNEETTRTLLALQGEAQQVFYDRVWDTWIWRLIVRLYMGDVLIGRCPPFYQRSDINVGDHFLSRMRHAMRNISLADNFFLEYVLLGEVSGKNGLPDYLQEANFSVLKKRIDRVMFEQGDLFEHMQAAKHAFHAIDLSNIFDFLPEEEHWPYRTSVLQHAQPSARIVHWSFVPMSPARLTRINTPFSPHASIDRNQCTQLNLEERAWFYQSFTVQTLQLKNGFHKNGHIKPIAQAINKPALACNGLANGSSKSNGSLKLNGSPKSNGHAVTNGKASPH